MNKLWFAALGMVLTLSACSDGGSKYADRFDALVPPGWTLDATTGSIKDKCTASVDCGSIERRYYLNTDLASATDAMEQFYPKQRCLAKREGNGVGVDCADVHLSISVTTETASITMTKR